MLARKIMKRILVAVAVIEAVSGFAVHRKYDTTIRSATEPFGGHQTTTTLNSLPFHDDHSSNSTPPSRRQLLQKVRIGAQSLIATSIFGQVVSAKDFQVPPTGMANGGPNRQRVGGLANKIRNSCKIMVRIIQ
jgi:hypothetical protein